ncbi:hypothetical protein [Thalassomonas sp. M1454]|uniref:hypothetical protein n=1 Tax=Thalassomonas sp. M1454 TaxID=2594477 RepID=UPI00117D20BB|nr:hypothetical protein [Thalassomonas sp. M1454]TRX58106.1 hypothetical protein FNN08_01585 [Thalassomonas sp. M1454]
MKNLTIALILSIISIGAVATEKTDILLLKIQNELNGLEEVLNSKLEKTFLENIKTENGSKLYFVPQEDVGFRCGLIVSNQNPEILYTLQYVSETSEWVPINGAPKKRKNWVISK